MPIASTDLELRLSGGSSNTTPAAALGGGMSTAGGGVVTSASANNVWDDVSASEAANDTEYRCLYVKNAHGTLTLQTAGLYIDSLTTSAGTEFDIGPDAAAIGSDSSTTIANESTAPAGVTFSRPTTRGTGLIQADIPAGSKKAFWIRRYVGSAGGFSTASSGSDTGSIRLEGDTA